MLTIHCRAFARYGGRIDAELGLGDLVILVKDRESGGDGSVVVHGPTLVTPRNWMPAGSSFHEQPGLLVFEHPERGEILEIWIQEEYHRHRSQDDLIGPLVKMGAEREFSDRLAQQPSLLGEDFQLVSREYRTDAGPVDLLCLDGHGRAVAVEVKRRTADVSALWQLKRYIAHLDRDPKYKKPRANGLLVAPHIRRNCMQMLPSEKRIGYLRLGYEDL